MHYDVRCKPGKPQPIEEDEHIMIGLRVGDSITLLVPGERPCKYWFESIDKNGTRKLMDDCMYMAMKEQGR